MRIQYTMRFEIEIWTIRKLLLTHEKKRLNLNPPYQRNDIWTEKAQKALITSIKEGMPIPNFFLHKRHKDHYDIADGQQRTRAIIAYTSKEIPDSENINFQNERQFLDYKIPIVIIADDVTEEEIRKFYVTVNNSGLRLNQPELTKSKYFDSNILELVEGLTKLKSFKELGIFSDKQESRMIDREFVEELVAQIKYGIGDKKNNIKRLYEENSNISKAEIKSLKTSFENVLKVCFTLNKYYTFEQTRYSQRNDFYTLFKFIYDNINLKPHTFEKFYLLLVRIQNDISPSNEKCEPLQFYAYRCVSQSNSKSAREDRLIFFNSLLLNDSDKPNKVQKALMKYYALNEDDLLKIEGYITLKANNIKSQFIEE